MKIECICGIIKKNPLKKENEISQKKKQNSKKLFQSIFRKEINVLLGKQKSNRTHQ